MSTRWFIDHNNTESGPFTSAQLRQLASKGRVTRETLVRRETDSDYFPSSRIQNLFNCVQPASVNEPAVTFAAYSDREESSLADSVAEYLYGEPTAEASLTPVTTQPLEFAIELEPSTNVSQQSIAQPTAVSVLRSGIGGLSVMWQTAGGILVAAGVLACVTVAGHELWAYNKWRIGTIRLRDEEAAKFIAVRKEHPEWFAKADTKPDMKTLLQGVRKLTPNKYSWFVSDGKSELEIVIPER